MLGIRWRHPHHKSRFNQTLDVIPHSLHSFGIGAAREKTKAHVTIVQLGLPSGTCPRPSTDAEKAREFGAPLASHKDGKHAAVAQAMPQPSSYGCQSG